MDNLIHQIKECSKNKPFIFISYSSKDKDYIYKDIIEFQKRGYNIWLDEKNLDKTNNSWKEDALKAIENIDCRLVVFYLSGYSLTSENCYEELVHTTSTPVVESHFQPVKIIVVDTKPIEDIPKYSKKIWKLIHKSNIHSTLKTKFSQILFRFTDKFFKNNERIRLPSRTAERDSNKYYSNILDYFPEETLQTSESYQESSIESSVEDYSNSPYEVMIAFNNSKTSRDYQDALELYHYLTSLDVPVFFPFVTEKEVGYQKYLEIIENALQKSKILVVIGEESEDLFNQWLLYEIHRFQQKVEDGSSNRVISYVDKNIFDGLPNSLQNQKVIFKDKESIQSLAQSVKKLLEELSLDNILKPFEPVFINDFIEESQFPEPSKNTIEEIALPTNPLLDFAQLLEDNDTENEFVNPYISDEMANIIASKVGKIEPYNAERCRSEGLEPIAYEVFLAQKIARINDPESCKKVFHLLHQYVNSWTVFLNQDKKVVGYWCFLALKEDSFKEIRTGQVNEMDISLKDARFIDMPGNYKGYLLLSGTIASCRTPKVVHELYDSWLKYLIELAEYGIFFDEICSMVGSPAGNSSLQNIGMTNYADYKFGGKMYSYDFNNIDKIEFLTNNYPELVELYQNK